MAARKTPRASALSTASPVTPPPAPVDAPSASAPAPQQPSEPAPVSTADKKKVGYYAPEDLIERARVAYAASAYLEGLHSFSEFHERAIRAEVERLENKHNGGAPFPVGRDGAIPRGRPLQK